MAVQLESKVVENYRKCFDRLFDSIQVEAESRVWQDELQEKEKARMHDVFRSYIKACETKFLQKHEHIAQLEAQAALGMVVHAQRLVQRMRHRLLAYTFDVLHRFVENAKEEKHKRDHYIQEQEREKARCKEQERQRARRVDYVATHTVQRMQDGLLAYAFDVLHRFVENAKQEKHKRDHYIQEQEREKARRQEQDGQRTRRIEYVRHIVQRMQDGLLAYAFDVLHGSVENAKHKRDLYIQEQEREKARSAKEQAGQRACRLEYAKHIVLQIRCQIRPIALAFDALRSTLENARHKCDNRRRFVATLLARMQHFALAVKTRKLLPFHVPSQIQLTHS